MNKLVATLIVGILLIVCAWLAIGRSSNTSNRLGGMSYTNTCTASDEAQLKEGARRIKEFKQELLDHGMRVVANSSISFSKQTSSNSSSLRGSKEQVTLRGDYGNLHNIEITLMTSDRLEVEAPQLSAGVSAQIGNAEEDAEFKALTKRLQFISSGV